MARPPKEINWKAVEKRIEAGNSAVTIAKECNIDISNFYDRFKKEYKCGFADYASKMKPCKPDNLEYILYMKALSGNMTALIHCVKEFCGHGKYDQQQQSPFEDIIDLRHDNMNLKAELKELKEKMNADKR